MFRKEIVETILQPIRKMKEDKRYVIFYCDECELLRPALTLFAGMHKDVTAVTFTSIDEVIAQVGQEKPEFIMIYLQDGRSLDIVKKLREHIDTTSVPIRIYHDIPDEVELRSVFKTL